MEKRDARFIGKVLVFLGLIFFLIPIPAFVYWIGNPYDAFVPQFSDILILGGLIFLGVIIASGGVKIILRFEEVQPFLTRGGEYVHSAEIWKKVNESGLYLTSCGRVVSINQTSKATAHVGYRLATAERATCRDCNLRDGSAIMDAVTSERGW